VYKKCLLDNCTRARRLIGIITEDRLGLRTELLAKLPENLICGLMPTAYLPSSAVSCSLHSSSKAMSMEWKWCWDDDDAMEVVLGIGSS
jgi:hypothetical protein